MDFQTTLDALRTADNSAYIDAVVQLYAVHKYVIEQQATEELDLTRFNRAFFDMLKTPEGKAAVEKAIAIAEEA